MSINDEVRKLAWDDLAMATRDRVRNKPSLEDVQQFLSNVKFPKTQNKFSSMWTMARLASGRLGVSWHISNDKKVTLLKEDFSITDKRKVFSSLRECFCKNETAQLRQAKNQGKTNTCIANHKESSHFLRTGDYYLRFTDWEFVHAARLGVLITNATMPGRQRSEAEQQCRWCSFRETIPHILNHCKIRLGNSITDRHDRIMTRLKNAASRIWKILKEHQPQGNDTGI